MSNDRAHFQDYLDQTRAKHDIVEDYLLAYFRILKTNNKRLLFVDGFAGRGTYTEAENQRVVDGSPLRALKLLASNKDLHQIVATMFVEADEVLFDQLKKTIDEFYSANQQLIKPICLHGTFEQWVGEMMKVVKGNLCPTFLFVDPCGVDGAHFNTIKSVMDCNHCEAFIFFNIDGVRRIAGLEDLSNTLVDLMGSKERAQALCDNLKNAKFENSVKREKIILSHYLKALADVMGTKYLIPFRIEHRDRKVTSHYLIHASKHYLGFRIMKGVMWGRGQADGEKGAMQLEQASRPSYIPMFERADIRKEKERIKAELVTGAKKVKHFTFDWVNSPENEWCEAAYKKMILEMETDGEVEILDKTAISIVPANKRPSRNKKPTLGEDYFVRLAKP